MNAIDRVEAHYRKASQLQGPILVPEWADEEGKPLEVHFRHLSMAVAEAIGDAVQDDDKGLAAALQMRAFDSEGKPLFEAAQLPRLRSTSMAYVVSRVVGLMNDSDDAAKAFTNDELGKPSTDAPSSG